MFTFKKTARTGTGLLLVLFAAGILCACSSNKSAVMRRTPDFCNFAENRSVPKVAKPAATPPGKDTPIGGDYKDKRR